MDVNGSVVATDNLAPSNRRSGGTRISLKNSTPTAVQHIISILSFLFGPG